MDIRFQREILLTNSRRTGIAAWRIRFGGREVRPLFYNRNSWRELAVSCSLLFSRKLPRVIFNDRQYKVRCVSSQRERRACVESGKDSATAATAGGETEERDWRKSFMESSAL